jgi:hypothetical protein
MISNTAIVKPAAPISRTAARLSFAAAGTLLVAVVALHFLEPGFDPSWRMVSEYALGRYGWLLTLGFLAWAASYASLVVAVRPHIRTTGGMIGLIWLLVNALGATMGAIFPIDPITSSPDAGTTSGILHGVGALLGIPTFPIAVTLISRSLLRNPAWASSRRSLVWMVGLVWLSIAVFVIAMATMFRGTMGPEVLIGWPNRLLILADSAWVMVVAWRAAQKS